VEIHAFDATPRNAASRLWGAVLRTGSNGKGGSMTRNDHRGSGTPGGRAGYAIDSCIGADSFPHGLSAAAGFDPLPFVHPELRPFMEPMRQLVGTIRLSNETLVTRRRVDFSQPTSEAPPFVDRLIAGTAGSPAVRVYVINAGVAATAHRPAILHMHGGGFVMLDARSSIHNLQDLAVALDCVIVTVDYRLAPETRFPGALNDNYAALLWLYKNADELGVDRMRIAVMGDSAGGGHAAMLAIAARDRGEVPLIFQALIYPMLDDRTGSSRRAPPHVGMVVWSAEDNEFGWTSLLGVPAGSGSVPHGSVPARESELSGLPPTFIGVGSIDLFADENVEYARRLMGAGVVTELHVVPGAFHGFDGLLMTTVAKQFRSILINALARGLHPNR